MPVARHMPQGPIRSVLLPSGGSHLWSSGRTSSPQTHERGHLVYAASGVLAVHTARGTSIVPANRIAWTPAGHTHQHSTHGSTDMRIVFLGPSLARHLTDRPAVFLASGLVREIVLAFTDAAADDAAPPRGDVAGARLQRVLVDELEEAIEQPLHLPAPQDDRLRAVAQLFSDSPGCDASLSEIGLGVGASSRTLSRLFRDELGMTFYEWRTQVRIHHALVLLAEGRDTTQTAHLCGWANPSNFIDAFTRVLHVTPGRYRAGQRPAGVRAAPATPRAHPARAGRTRSEPV